MIVNVAAYPQLIVPLRAYVISPNLIVAVIVMGKLFSLNALFAKRGTFKECTYGAERGLAVHPKYA